MRVKNVVINTHSGLNAPFSRLEFHPSSNLKAQSGSRLDNIGPVPPLSIEASELKTYTRKKVKTSATKCRIAIFFDLIINFCATLKLFKLTFIRAKA